MSDIKTKTKNWWTTMPGIITALASLLTALGGFLVVLHSLNNSANGEKNRSNSTAPAANMVIVKDSSKIEGVVGNVSGKNVNVGSNYGRVGDEYNGVKQRKVTEELINKITSLSPNKKFQIGVYHTATDPETLNFVNDLIDHLKQTGYKKIGTSDMTIVGENFVKHREYILAFPDTIFAKKDPDQFFIFVPPVKNFY